MEIHEINVFASFTLASALLLVSGFLFWRYLWFFRNPSRNPPPGIEFLSPADGTVVYAKIVEPDQPVITIKQGISASVNDVTREHLGTSKILIRIFMSPFDVHFNA